MSDINPYDTRNHESPPGVDKSDVRAVAALLGTVSGSLREIDKKVITDSQFTKAHKIDPKQSLKEFAGSINTTPDKEPQPTNPQIPELIPTPEPRATHDQIPSVETKTVTQVTPDLADIHKRLNALENTSKGIGKFKRGITYNVSSLNVKGNFKCKEDILSAVSSELNKQVKVITIRIDDANKNTKQK